MLKKNLAGINKLHDAVSSTLDPKVEPIIANEYGQPYVTKDGVSARAINFKDPVENIGKSR
jgi:chaperonin GroEL (HSP60 family)